jgi:hypothetical protein
MVDFLRPLRREFLFLFLFIEELHFTTFTRIGEMLGWDCSLDCRLIELVAPASNQAGGSSIRRGLGSGLVETILEAHSFQSKFDMLGVL